MKQFVVNVSYSQLAIFNHQMDRPFNDWNSEHVRQGFSWREGSVSFRTLDEFFDLVVACELVEEFPSLHSDSVQVIEVPLQVGTHGIEVGSITNSERLLLPENEYEVRLEFLNGSNKALIWLSTKETKRFRVIKLHHSLEIPKNLVLMAEPA